MGKSRKFVDTYSFLKGNVGVLMGARTIWSFSRMGVDSYFSLFILALGGSAEITGIFSMVGSIAQFVTRPIGGYLADNADRRRVIGTLTVTLALSYLTYVFAPNALVLLAGAFIVNLCFMQTPAMQSLVADSLSDEQMAVGFSTQIAIERVTPFALAFVGGIVIEKTGTVMGVRLGYLGAVIGGFIVAYIRYHFLRETRKPSIKSFSFSSVPSVILRAYKESFLFLREISREVKMMALVAVLGSLAALLTGPFWIIYINKVIGLTPTQMGFIIMFSGILEVIASIFSGHIVNRFGRKRMLVVSLFLMSPLALSFIYCTNFLQVLVCWSLIAVLIAFLTPSFQALLMSLVPIEQRGRTIAAIGLDPFNILRYNVGMMANLGFIAYIPAIFFSFFSGYIYNFNPMYPWFLLSSVLGIMAFLCTFLINEKKKSKD